VYRKIYGMRCGCATPTAYGEAMPARHLVHHLGVFAGDFAASESFYTKALARLRARARR
jgi:hypothetical protein